MGFLYIMIQLVCVSYILTSHVFYSTGNADKAWYEMKLPHICKAAYLHNRYLLVTGQNLLAYTYIEPSPVEFKLHAGVHGHFK